MFVLLNLLTGAGPGGRDRAARRLVAARRPAADPKSDAAKAGAVDPDRSRQGQARHPADDRSGDQAAVEHRFEDRPRATGRRRTAGQRSRSRDSAGLPARFQPRCPRIGRSPIEAPKGFAKVDTLFEQQEEKHADRREGRQARPQFHPHPARRTRERPRRSPRPSSPARSS